MDQASQSYRPLVLVHVVSKGIPEPHTINVEEWQESQYLVAITIWPAIRFQMACLSCFDHHRIGDNISMRKHHAFRMPGCTGRIHKKGEIFGWLGLCSPVSRGSSWIYDACEVLESVRSVSLISHEDNPIQRYANLRCRLLSLLEKRKLGNNCFCLRVFQLKRKLFNCIVRIGRTQHSSSPVTTPCYCRRVDT